jgi:hypothetical protein
LDEFFYALGAFCDEDFGGWAMDEAVAGVFGVLEMESYVFFTGESYGDAALGVVGVGFAERLLGDYEDLAVVSEFDGCAQAGYACSDDEIIYAFRLGHNL